MPLFGFEGGEGLVGGWEWVMRMCCGALKGTGIGE